MDRVHQSVVEIIADEPVHTDPVRKDIVQRFPGSCALVAIRVVPVSPIDDQFVQIADRTKSTDEAT
ncbi:hypothetical protein D3C87_2142900 [compost metagenome]